MQHRKIGLSYQTLGLALLGFVLGGLLVCLTPQTALAFPEGPGKIPNGTKYNCDTCHVSHFDPNTQQKVYDFTVVTTIMSHFNSTNPVRQWVAPFYQQDSDVDGWTNGEELGDPNGVWVMGDPAPGLLGNISNPGLQSSRPPQPQITAVNGLTAGEIISGGLDVDLTIQMLYPNSVNRVRFRIYNENSSPVYDYLDMTAPYCLTPTCEPWDSTGEENGPYELRVTVHDKSLGANGIGGARDTNAEVPFTLANPVTPQETNYVFLPLITQ